MAQQQQQQFQPQLQPAKPRSKSTITSTVGTTKTTRTTPSTRTQFAIQQQQAAARQLPTSNTAVGKFLQAIMRNGGDLGVSNMYKPYMNVGEDIVLCSLNTNNLNYAKQLIASSTTTGASYLGSTVFLSSGY